MKRWYVVQICVGCEEQVKGDILKSIEEKGLQDSFGQILIPSTKAKQFFSASTQDATLDQQLFPGYLLVEMDAVPQAFRLITTRNRVVRFLGGHEPVALSPQEVERVKAQMRGEVAIPVEKHELEIGKEVEISDGPFSGFVGIIEKVDDQNEKLTVMVSIFGRMTPVELNFDQVKQ